MAPQDDSGPSVRVEITCGPESSSSAIMAILIAFSTCPDEPTADRIADALVSEGLAACVNRLPGVRSTYIWEGRLQRDEEILLIIKTTAEKAPQLQARLQALHPYEVPEFIAAPVVAGNEPYLDWVRRAVANRGQN